MLRRHRRSYIRKAHALKKEGMQHYKSLIPFLREVSQLNEEQRKLLELKAHPDEQLQQKWNDYMETVNSVQRAQKTINLTPKPKMSVKKFVKLSNKKNHVSKHHKSQVKR